MILQVWGDPVDQPAMDQVGTPTEWESRGEGGGTCPVVSTKLHLGETVEWGWLVWLMWLH